MSLVFVITGASSGIGAATARRAAEAGHRVVLAARSLEKLETLTQELGGRDRAIAIHCDVTDWADQQRLAEEALAGFGRIDVVFANAGYGATPGFTSETPDYWRNMILTNVLGPALSVRATLEAVKETKGHYVLTGSVAGHRAIQGSVYSATKFAVTGMAEALRQELNDTGIRVTLISPGAVDTPFFNNPPQFTMLEPDDIARAVLFATSQPDHVDVNTILVRSTAQAR